MQHRSRSRSEAARDGQRQKERHRLVLSESGDSATGCNAQSDAFRIEDCSSTLGGNSDSKHHEILPTDGAPKLDVGPLKCKRKSTQRMVIRPTR